MDRFSAYLLVRRHLKRPRSRNQALAVEAIMEELAALLDQPREAWGVLGLLSQMDLEYADQNPRARGQTASQQARLEGLDEAAARHLERWCRRLSPEPEAAPAHALEPVEHALLLATLLAEEALEARARDHETLSAQDLDLRRQRGDVLGDGIDAALSELRLPVRAAAELAERAVARIAQDLR
jgi:predicted hydrolase (HD superfamily)